MPSPDTEHPKEAPQAQGTEGGPTDPAGKVFSRALEHYKEVGDVVPFVRDLDAPSVAVGLAGGLVVFLLLAVVYKVGKLVLKLALTAAIVALVGGAYFGWLKSPADIRNAVDHSREALEDAKKAAERVRSRIGETEAGAPAAKDR